MGHTESDDAAFNSLILATLTGNRRATDALFRHRKDYIERLIANMAPDLPWDLRENALQEAFIQLMQVRPDRYNSRLGSPKAFLRGLVRDAIRSVRASMTPAGQPTRNRVAAGAEPALPPRVQIVAVKPVIATAEDAEDVGASRVFEQVDARIDAEKVLAAAPSSTAKALEMIFLQDMPKQEVAARLGLNRFDLYREIEAFAARVAGRLAQNVPFGALAGSARARASARCTTTATVESAVTSGVPGPVFKRSVNCAIQ
jgi:DNA-directed RNA polymerase specialized sigma24 family protein